MQSAPCSAVVLAALLAAVACCASFTVGPSFVASKSFYIVEEGVSVDSVVLQSNALAQQRTTYSTPNGYYTQQLVVNVTNKTATLHSGFVYMFYDVNGETICYSYPAGPFPWPFPTTGAGGLTYVKQGVFQRTPVGVYEFDVGRYRRRMYTNASNVSSTYFMTAVSNTEGMNTLNTGLVINASTRALETPSSFALPAACKAKVKASPHLQGVAEVLFPHGALERHGAANGMLTFASHAAAIKFGVAEGSNGVAELNAVLRDAERSGAPVTKYRASRVSLPVSVDNRRYATATRDQSFCGGCWAFSSAALSELVYNFKHNISSYPLNTNPNWFSVQNLLDCAVGDLNGTALFPSKGCFGGWPLVALTHIIKQGVMFEAQYTYDGVNGRQCKQQAAASFRPLSSASYIPLGQSPATNLPLLMSAVATNGGVIAIMNADPILFYSGGIFNSECAASLGHAVVLIGFGTDPASSMDYWIVKNSFGSSWGENGYFRIRRGINLCGIEQMGFVALSN